MRRCGYKNVAKGIRRLEQLYTGDLDRGALLLREVSSALKLSPGTVQQALDQTNRQVAEMNARLAAEADALWRASFKPHACLLGTSDRPSQIFIYGVTGGAERWLNIALDLSQPPLSYAAQALSVVRRTPAVQFFGPTSGFIVNYTPDHAVRFDLEGRPVETLTRAYRPDEITLYLSRREIPTERFGRCLGLVRFFR